jgi:hypothetical protein
MHTVETVDNSEKRVHLNLKVLPAIKSGVGHIAKRERRSESSVAEILLEWALNQLTEKALSVLDLIETERPRYAARISPETQEILFTALRTILERAPLTAVEDVTEQLVDLAGKYGDGPDRRSSSTPRGKRSSDD